MLIKLLINLVVKHGHETPPHLETFTIKSSQKLFKSLCFRNQRNRLFENLRIANVLILFGNGYVYIIKLLY